MKNTAGGLTRLLVALALFHLLGAGAAFGALTLVAEVNPDPAQPNEMLDVQLTVASTSASGSLTLRVLWPNEIDQFPVTTGGGSCPGSCDTGEYLTWNLGSLGPGGNVTVSFNEHVESFAADGTFMLEIDLLEGGSLDQTLNVPVEVQDDSPLEIFVDPLADPVAAGSSFEYEIVYGNTSSAVAENAELVFPVPTGTQFLSASGGGSFSAGSVTWDLGPLPAGGGGRERVRVSVNALGTGTPLAVDAATVTGELNFQSRTARATAVSRVGISELELGLELNPDPPAPGEMIDSQITVFNSGGSATGTLSLRVLWPTEIDQFPVTTELGSCPGSCDTGEYLVWNLGVLGPGIARTVSFNEHAETFLVSGRLIPVEVELLEGGLPSRNLSHTARVKSDSPLEVLVDALSDPVAAGSRLVYEVVYGNNGNAAADGAVLSFPVPVGSTFLSATGSGVHSAGRVEWDLGSLAPGSGGRERVTVVVGSPAATGLLIVDSAVISGTINFQGRTARSMAVSRIGSGDLALALEINPDPAAASQLLDGQISIGNPTASVTGNLTLRVLWPNEIDQFPEATSSGSCPGSCDTGEYLSWDLGLLGPGTSHTVSFNEHAESFLEDGTLIPVEIELLEGGLPARSVSHTVRVQSDSPLAVLVDPSVDPVAPSGTVTYDIVYGNNGNNSANSSTMSFPVPAGSQLLSTTGVADTGGGSVSWNLGTLAPNSGGRERVTVQVDPLAEGSLLVVDAATLSGEVGFQSRSARGRAVSRVATQDLELSWDLTPNPVLAGEVLDGDLMVTNPVGGGSTGSLTLRVLWPTEIDQFPVTTGGGSCPGSCDSGEYLSWDLGTLGPGASVSVDFNENAETFLTQGTLVPVEVELLEAGRSARSASTTALVHPTSDNDNDGEADVLDPDDDNDQMPDWWETFYGLNPFNAGDAGLDPDMDGLTNLEEFQAGTNPNVSDFIFFDGFESAGTGNWSDTVP